MDFDHFSLKQLKDGITPAERAALESGGEGLVISRYNRATLLRLLAMEDSPAEPRVDPASLEAMTAALGDYLNRFLPDQPEAHKWILLSCVFLAFVVREPLHPREIVQWEARQDRYLCPLRDLSPLSLCRWCVCGGAS